MAERDKLNLEEGLSAAGQVIWFLPIKEGQKNCYSDVRNTFGAHIFKKGAGFYGRVFTGDTAARHSFLES